LKSESSRRLAVTHRAYQHSSAVVALCAQVSPLMVDDVLAEPSADVLLDFVADDGKNEPGLTLQFLQQPHWKPLRWSFTEATWLRRLQQASRHQESLLKVAGKNIAQLNIVDATGGRGYDALLLAKAGAHVSVCERDPLIFALLQDAQQRARQHPLLAPYLERMQWQQLDSVDYLQMLSARHEHPDLVYCDPMFPQRSKSALNQKNLLALQHWLGHGEEDQLNRLLQQALDSAQQRVILKYASHQPLPTTIKPTFSQAGRGHHWYVFLTSNSVNKGDL
jgi:16S rRNA (guanine1516-N2)-methyltransferase